jgi:AcrR family transcriptional regulator
MSPRNASFESQDVLEAAVAVVRERGLANLSARAVARQLRASVAPVYKHFRSMDDLVRAVLEAARVLLDERTRKAYSDIPFLNIGVGIVIFSREEGHLFSALFHSRHHCQDILNTFYDSVLARMKEDRMLMMLSDSSLENLLHSIWLYTLGLATAVIYGQLPDTRTETIIGLLKNVGSVMMYAEAAGIADTENPEHEKEWARLIKEKNYELPTGEIPRPPAGEEEES